MTVGLGATSGHGRLALDGQRHVEEQLVGVVAGEHLHADRQAVDVPAGIETAGLP